MLVFCNGIAGCGEKEYLEEFRSLADDRDRDVRIHELGERILEIGRRDYPELDKYDLIGFPESTVRAWRSAAFESIKKDLGEADVDVIDAHASFWIKNGPEPAVSTSYLSELDPDMFVQIIDYEPDIHDRLQENSDLTEENALSLEEVIRWQEVERYTNRLLSEQYDAQFYILARQHPARSLYDMLFETDRPRVYQSFPITNLDEKHLDGIKDYVDRLRDHAVVFDPIELDVRDFSDDTIAELINSHTVKRDQQFIDQADLVVVNFPEMVYSSGVEYEVNYAARTGTPVWIIKPEGHVGPFTEFTCDREFNDEQSCIKAVEERYS